MLFFPYRADIQLTTLPIVTIAIVLLCIGIYVLQVRNEQAIVDKASDYCATRMSAELKQVLARAHAGQGQDACVGVLRYVREFYDRDQALSRVSDALRRATARHPMGADYFIETLREHVRAFEATAPRSLTARLWFEPPSANVLRMLTSAVAHGSWGHLLGNLFFFVAFAVTVEMLIGPVLFFLVVVALAVGIGAVDSLVHLLSLDPRPTLGLSGVVMGVLGLFVYFVPQVRIRFFLWLIFWVRTFGIPAWLVALWFVGWDAYDSWSRVDNGINLVAHLAGAALGLLLGLVLFRAKRHWAQELVHARR
jgi:membrane associated rhomboid family serine protease